MIKTWVAVEADGNISAATTTDPSLNPSDDALDYQYEFLLTWEQFEDLWRYKVVDGKLTLK